MDYNDVDDDNDDDNTDYNQGAPDAIIFMVQSLHNWVITINDDNNDNLIFNIILNNMIETDQLKIMIKDKDR